MKESRKEFIVRAHQSACCDWKKEIETEFPKLFKGTNLVVGSWYKTTQNSTSYLINITELVFDKNHKGSISQKHYGFENGEFKKGSWNNTSFSNSLIAATDKEVETALFAEAKKRGFEKGVYFESVIRTLHNGSLSRKFIATTGEIGLVLYKHYKETSLLNDGGGTIFYNGEWATIIPPIKQMTLEQVQKELGYKIKIIN
jgi:hypothetical protein